MFAGTSAFCAHTLSGKSPRIRWMADLRHWDLKGDETFRQASGAGMQSFLADEELFEAYRNRPEELKNILKAAGMKKWILQAGILPFDGSDKPEILKYLENMADFGGKAGAGYLLVSAEKRDSYPAGKAKLSRLAMSLDAVADIAGKHGLKVLISNSMHSIFQSSDELEFTCLQWKSRNLALFLDLAQMAQSGTKPQDFIRKMGKKIAAIRFNDLSRPVKGFSGPNNRNYLLEIPGNGNSLSYPEIREALRKAKFKGGGILGNASPEDKSSPIQTIQAVKEWLKKVGFGF
jgi:sugar phosphate isomerase/epimerase